MKNPKDRLRWWDHKQRILEHWLDTSGDEITVEGASALIRGQLQRGEAHEHLRIKCWKHIVIELSALVEDDTAPSNGASAVMTGRYGTRVGALWLWRLLAVYCAIEQWAALSSCGSQTDRYTVLCLCFL